jgi:intergrase/recombinase
MELFDPAGHRLYLANNERAAFLDAAKTAPREVRTFCHVLHDTGCRLSEALALPVRPNSLSCSPSSCGSVILLYDSMC